MSDKIPTETFTVSIQQEIDVRALYSAVVYGMECGSYSSFEIAEGDWEKGWRGADAGQRESFAHVKLDDRYESGVKDLVALTDERLARGFQRLAKAHPSIAARILEENGDALDGDAFLQMVCLGSIIYG